MTNEKAIEILKLYKQRLEESVSTELGNDIKAFGMAISALEQTDGDLISRQAVIDGLASIAKAKAKSDAQKALMGRAMYFVEKLPSAEQTDSVLEDMKAEFIKRYPLNYCGEPELGGVSCVFSLNEVLKIIDRHISRKEGD